MEGSSENRDVAKPVNLKGRNRRALQDIENLIGVHHPIVAAKRQLNGKNPVVARRPVTRKYAAALESKSQSCDQEASSEEMERNGESSIGKVHLTDVVSPMIEESKQMEDCEAIEEVVMEELIVDTVRDIDGFDLQNPLAVVEYVNDIYKYYKRVEFRACVDPNYMSTQSDINEQMRAILVDWLIEVHHKFELMEETLYLTVNLLDRFLSKQTVVRKKLQLVGATALFLACKYEEISVPLICQLVQISDKAYTKEEVLSMEKLMANTLQFNFSVPTPYVFLQRFLKAAESDEKLKQLSHYMIELCLVDYEMLQFTPSLLAASVVFTAKCCMEGFKSWTKTCISYTTYTPDQLMECSQMVVKLHQKSGQGKLKSVYSKYNTFRFGYVVRFEPALFLLEDDI